MESKSNGEEKENCREGEIDGKIKVIPMRGHGPKAEN